MTDPRLQRIVAAQPIPPPLRHQQRRAPLRLSVPGFRLRPPRRSHPPAHRRGRLDVKNETLEDSRVIKALEMDIVSHDIRKFFHLADLQSAHESTRLPEIPSDQTRAALNDLLIRLRTRACASSCGKE